MSSVLLNGIGNGGLTSLRKTRSSEVSTFVKNYNQAQSRFMRKEVDIWYKSTRHTLRSMSDNQQKLYGSLLKLSKEKKAIKMRREDDLMQKKISRENYLRRKEQLNRRRQLATRDTKSSSALNILILEHPDDERHHTVHNEPVVTAFKSILEENESDQQYAEENETEPLLLNEQTTSPHDKNESVNDLSQQTGGTEIEAKTCFTNIYDSTRQLNDRKVTSDDFVEPPAFRRSGVTDKMHSKGLLTSPKIIPHSTTLVSRCGIQETSSTSKCDTLIEEESNDTTSCPLFADQITYLTNPSLPPIKNETNNQEITAQRREQFGIKETEDGSNSGISTTRMRPKGKKLKFKTRPDPTEELNARSSIQAMQGKTYEVSSYRRDSRGSLCEERKTMDTTVDVSQYFNFKYYQDRKTRLKMFENSKLLEQKQNKRVQEFLMKLNQDEEKVRIQAETKAKQMEEERLEVQKREAHVIKKPPRYGLQREYTVTPGYVRKYKRRSCSRRASRDNVKSSWKIPSVCTLNLKTAAANHSSLFNEEDRQIRQAAEIQQMQSAFSGHLVNVNLEKYVKRDKRKKQSFGVATN